MSEKRNLESIRLFYIGMLIFNIIYNVLFYLNNLGIYIDFLGNFNIRSVLILDFNILLFLAIVIIFHKKNNIDEDTKIQISNKIKPLYFINIFFIGYIIVSIFIIKDMDITLSSLVMELIYMGIIILTKRIMALSLTDRQLQWRKAYECIDDPSEESNFLWRFKIWCSPHVYVPFKNRWKGASRLLYDIILIYIIITTSIKNLFTAIPLFLLLPDLLSWIEGLLGLQTSLTGICTGITEHHGKNSSYVYHKVYVTDYKNKREITFYVDGSLFIDENSYLTVVHGMFSKRVLYVEGLHLNIR